MYIVIIHPRFLSVNRSSIYCTFIAFNVHLRAWKCLFKVNSATYHKGDTTLEPAYIRNSSSSKNGSMSSGWTGLYKDYLLSLNIFNVYDLFPWRQDASRCWFMSYPGKWGPITSIAWYPLSPNHNVIMTYIVWCLYIYAASPQMITPVMPSLSYCLHLQRLYDYRPMVYKVDIYLYVSGVIMDEQFNW